MLGMCGLRRQRLTFLAKSRTPLSSAPPSSIHLGLSLLICKMGRTPPPSQDRDESQCRGEAPAAEKPAPTSAPWPGGRRPGGALALEFPGTISLTLGRNHLPPPHHQVHHPPRSGASRAGCQPGSRLGPGGMAPHSGWLVPDKHKPRRCTHCRAGATQWPWGRGGALGRTAKASGGLRTRERVGGARGKAGRPGERAGTAGSAQLGAQ